MAGVPLLVGIDVSAEVIPALRWALDEARARGCDVRLVHAPDKRDATLAETAHLDVDGAAVPRLVVEVYRAIATRIAPDATIQTAVLDGSPPEALIRASAEASLVVLGSRGRADFTESALGSVAQRVASHAQCPVVIVPDVLPQPSAATVVVGVADEPAGRRAVDFAADAAHRSARTLVMVRSTHLSDSGGADTLQHASDQLIALARRYPDLTVRAVLTRQDAAQTLTEAARDADLLVVGCRHSDDRFGARLGSVPAAVLDRVRCPIVLVGHTGTA